MNVEKVREKYPVGTQIELDEMKGETQMPKGLRGIVTHVDDMSQIHMQWENGSSLALNLEEDSFKVIEQDKLKVLLVEPHKYPKVVEIPHTLEAMQELVGGYIEEYMPFDDDVAIVCNEEGKMMGEELNRAIYDKENQMIDIIAGKFFVCYAPIESEKFLSLPKELEQKYHKRFKYPENFFKTDNGIIAESYKPVSKDLER